MKIYNLKRGAGKTTSLILISHLTQRRIITAYAAGKKYIQLKAEEMELQIPEPYCLAEVQHKRGCDDPNPWIIDDVNIVASVLLEQALQHPVSLGLMTADNELDQEGDN